MPDIYDMQQDAYPSTSEIDEIMSMVNKDCEHKDIIKERHYYGIMDEQFYYYFKCDSCGEEIEDLEPDEDLMRDR
tara:strand:- start:84 stop:308 length:225 start_codon:yes stop_codon:yes gene_type:complete